MTKGNKELSIKLRNEVCGFKAALKKQIKNSGYSTFLQMEIL